MPESASEMAITFESLFELLRREKNREALQKLNPAFYRDVRVYLLEKQQRLGTSSEQDTAEREKVQRQLENIRKLLRELYERREKKILTMALNESRSHTPVDHEALLPEEKVSCDLLLQILKKSRQEQFESLFEPGAEPLAAEPPLPEKIKADAAMSGPLLTDAPDAAPASATVVRFIRAVPRFIGTELEEYGPYEEEEIANLPRDIAKVLIERGRAERIE